MRTPVSLLLATVLALTGCSSSDGRLVIFAASSLEDVLRAVAPDARIEAAGSDTLAAQVREGALADVYAAAAPAPAEALLAQGLIDPPVAFATNRIVVIVPTANPARIEGIDDLRRPGVRLVVGAPEVPIGDHTRAVLRELAALEVLRNAVSEEQNVNAVAGKVAFGEADAGFVYATDVAALGARVRSIDLPAVAVPISAVIAVVRSTTRRAAAEAVIATMLQDRGRRILSDAGFGPP